MYIRDNLAFTSVQLDSTNNTDLIVCVELSLPKSKPIIVGTCYRSPQNNDFMNKFEICVHNLEKTVQLFFLVTLTFVMVTKKVHFLDYKTVCYIF
jgi:hypothetical protein